MNGLKTGGTGTYALSSHIQMNVMNVILAIVLGVNMQKKMNNFTGYDYEEQWDSTDRICPYCGNSYQVEGEDYSEDDRVEECDECGKKFWAFESFSVECYAKPDCEINGETHKWIPKKVREGFHDFCSVCGKCRPFEQGEICKKNLK